MRVTAITLAEFADLQSTWTQLQSVSDADPLFMSWRWLWTWWSVFGQPPGLRLRRAVDRTGRMVGIAPWWLTRERLKGIVPVRRLQFIGNRWRHRDTEISEYTDFVVERSCRSEIVRALLDSAAADDDWDEFVMTAVRSDSSTVELLQQFAAANGWLLRVCDRATSYRISLEGGFNAFLARLSGAARRQLFNKRGRLPDRSTARVAARDPDGVGEVFAALNRFHGQRWGRPVFAGTRLEFQRRICEQALTAGQLCLEMLVLERRPLSVVFDLRTAATEYNIQSGFEANHASGLSPGLMHLGYAIESAAAAGMKWFDLLAGRGRTADYKRPLADERIELFTVQLVRSAWLAQLYRLWDRVGG